MVFGVYLESEDAICPRCKSDKVHSIDYAWQQKIFCSCNNCLAEFKIPWFDNDNYKKFDFRTGFKFPKNK